MRLLALALAVVVSGCFQLSSVLSVRADGSATLRDEVRLSGFGLMAMQEDAGASDEAEFEDRAGRLGSGVRLASVERRDDGFTVVYDIDDVRTLAYTAPGMGEGDESEGQFPMTFGFAEGESATLDIRLPKPDPGKPAASDAAPADAAQQAQALTMMRSMMGEARISMAVEVEGAVEETNATYADGATITLVDLPMGPFVDALAERPDLLAADGPPDASALAELLKDVPEVRIQTPGTVRVRFR
ncbi:hypothetical protein [Rubrivirga sp. IMCC43871]|uniref:hypothetical protein n=1 Tax=Rubrivirga sp. IMCC43871 TaxID=3391575 RepID=UPI00398FA9F9